ncbi:MAG: FMN-binding protein [Erysipelotrichaceae bacterium]|nr:FMN-binding protein [Erysipelotrichaceae bacterium]MDP3305209.1 FMN-binding protein [Erysipelotrichaceae bacterium]
MKRYLNMVWFILILGTLTSVVFVGMEVWTRPLIDANAANELKSIVLSANDISFNTGNISAVFDENIETEKVGEYTFYVEKSSGRVSYQFSGGGVWGPIIGIITLENDKETIRQIRIMQQEETPGLGGVVADLKYLAKYVGIMIVPKIEVNIPDSAANKPNEVDSITGATRTSKAFEQMLNDNYAERVSALAQLGE